MGFSQDSDRLRLLPDDRDGLKRDNSGKSGLTAAGLLSVSSPDTVKYRKTAGR